MAVTWKHPLLGVFEFNGYWWGRNVDAPAFDAFTYVSPYASEPRPAGTYPLAFSADDESDFPSTEAVDMALAVIAAQTDIVSLVVHAFWEDLNGRGPQSGMWWHGGLDELADSEEEAEKYALTQPSDLLASLALSSITVAKPSAERKRPIVELGFDAWFEEEHGVGVLTDGQAIIGIGYMATATPFKT